MSWLDRYQDASYKGVGFKVSNHSLKVGRKVIKHEYPERDTPYMEDLGRKFRTYTVTGYLVGEDYDVSANPLRGMGSRDQLIAALESQGSGELIHPYLGTVTVIPDAETVISEKKEEGGMCRFTISFVEQGALISPTPTIVSDNASEREALIEAKNDEIEAEFNEDFSLSGTIESVSVAARELFREINEQVQQVVDIARLPIEIAAQVEQIIIETDEFINALIIDYRSLAKGYRDILGLLGEGSRFNAMLQTLSNIFNITGISGDETTTSGQQINANNAATIAMITGFVATTSIEFAIAATDVQPDDEAGDTFTSRQEAIEQRDLLGQELDTIMENEEDDNQFITWRELYNQLYEEVPGGENDLATAATVVIAQTMPSLVMAHGLYGDASQDLDIVRRNNPEHPGFMPSNVPLEVRLP